MSSLYILEEGMKEREKEGSPILWEDKEEISMQRWGQDPHRLLDLE